MRAVSRYIQGSNPAQTIVFNRRDDSITVNVPYNAFKKCADKWNHGAMIQEAFPMLNATEREFMITGFTAEEQKEIFGE